MGLQSKIMMKHLKSVFEGSDYDQTLKLFYDEAQAFYGVADDLVTSVNGELQLRLNFLGGEGFLHTLRISGEFVVLVPVIASVNAEAYLKSSSEMVLAWPLKDLVSLWEQLRYDPEELKSLAVATSSELFLVWLISSQYYSVQVLDSSTMSDLVGKNIIAEDVNGVPSTIDIINQLSKGELLLETVERISSTEDNAITVYINDVDGSAIEWKSISSDRKRCLIGNDLGVQLINPT
ncbi:MAG: hypothetical protein CENE_03031 [Candidatus Celerinatantimonas neptuna]|nr:MAG: hypothetical protein CENE_03031 [Candidatus Celerinatantimonas neptuna]